jgi:hypothetical protein
VSFDIPIELGLSVCAPVISYCLVTYKQHFNRIFQWRERALLGTAASVLRECMLTHLDVNYVSLTLCADPRYVATTMPNQVMVQFVLRRMYGFKYCTTILEKLASPAGFYTLRDRVHHEKRGQTWRYLVTCISLPTGMLSHTRARPVYTVLGFSALHICGMNTAPEYIITTVPDSICQISRRGIVPSRIRCRHCID